MQPVFDGILGCARDNDVAGIQELLRAGCPPGFANRMGQTALHVGAIWGSVEAVKVLLLARGDPGAQNKMRGTTPLHAAAMGRGPADKRAQCVKVMLELKADPRKGDFEGELPIDCADDEAIRIALGAAPLILHQAIRARKIEALAAAIDQARGGVGGLSLDGQDPAGDTALHVAVAQGWREGADRILAARADPDVSNGLRRTPVHTAVQRGNLWILQRLLDARAAPSAKDRDPEHDPRFSSKTYDERPYEHRTPLHYAAELGSVVAVRALLHSRAELDARDSQQQTPLHLYVAQRGQEVGDEAELDVGSGVRVHGLQTRPEWNGRLGAVLGPAGIAADGSAPRQPVLLEGASDGVLLKRESLERLGDEVLDLLLEARADVNLGNRVWGEDVTVLHEAARKGDAALLGRALAAGGDMARTGGKLGFAPLHLAARGRKEDAVRCLLEAKADIEQRTTGGKTAAELADANGAAAGGALLALLRGEAPPPAAAPAKEARGLESLTKEQRAMLFID